MPSIAVGDLVAPGSSGAACAAPRRMERIRAKQEKYHQERLPAGEGQDEARPGKSWGGHPKPPAPPAPSPIAVGVASTHRRRFVPHFPRPASSLSGDQRSLVECSGEHPPTHTPLPKNWPPRRDGSPPAPLSPRCRSTAPGGPADPSRQRERWWRPWLDHATGTAPARGTGGRAVPPLPASLTPAGSGGDGAFGEVTPCMPPSSPPLGINQAVLCF